MLFSLHKEKRYKNVGKIVAYHFGIKFKIRLSWSRFLMTSIRITQPSIQEIIKSNLNEFFMLSVFKLKERCWNFLKYKGKAVETDLCLFPNECFLTNVSARALASLKLFSVIVTHAKEPRCIHDPNAQLNSQGLPQMVLWNLMSYHDTGHLLLAETDKHLDRVTLISSFHRIPEVVVIHQFI